MIGILKENATLHKGPDVNEADKEEQQAKAFDQHRCLYKNTNDKKYDKNHEFLRYKSLYDSGKEEKGAMFLHSREGRGRGWRDLRLERDPAEFRDTG